MIERGGTGDRGVLHRISVGKSGLVAMLLAGVAAGACQGSGPIEEAKNPNPGKMVGVTPTKLAQGCGRTQPGLGLYREGEVRQGSSVALVRDPADKTQLFAYVADADEKALDLVHVGSKAGSSKTIAQVGLEGTPEQVLVLTDGRVAVSLVDTGFVDIYEPTGEAKRPLEHRCRLSVPAGPFGLAVSEDDTLLGVTSAHDAALTVFDGQSLEPRQAFALARSPRGLLFQDHRAFVSHVTGANLTVVQVDDATPVPRRVNLAVRAGTQVAQPEDLAKLRTGSQAFTLVSVDVTPSKGQKSTTEDPKALQGDAPKKATKPARRIVVPMVTVDPGDRSQPSQFYYGPPPVAGISKHSPIAVVVDPVSEKSLVTHVIAPTGDVRREECLLPRAAAYRASTQRLYVACMGIDTVLELDARAADPMRAVVRRFDVPTRPTGLALSDAEGVLVVAAQEHGQIAKIRLGAGDVEFANLTRTTSAERSQEFHLGRELFFRTDDPRITGDGVACASCHPDGLDDGITWSTPEGPRQTLMLAGRLTGSAPYGWSRNQATLDAYISDTVSRLGGREFPKDDVAALGHYIKDLPRPPMSNVNVSLVARGEQIFAERGCTSCHAQVAEDGPTPAPKDVGSKTEGDWVKEFDTPSLTGVKLSAPYYHDGRYLSLDALLSDPQSQMGKTKELTQDDRSAIKVYLESL